MTVLASEVVPSVAAPAEDFSTASTGLPVEEAFSARVRGMSVRADVIEDARAEVAASGDVHVQVRFSIGSSSVGVEPFSSERVVTLNEYQELQSRLNAIAPYGEDYYPDHETTARAWNTYARLMKAAAEAPDLGEFLKTSRPGDMTYNQTVDQ